MDENELQAMLGKQYLIPAYIETKLQIVNYIKDGYDANKPVLMNNRFLHFTAHTHYRSVVVDLHALFGKANTNNKYSFFHIDSRYKSFLVDGAIEKVQSWLNASQKDIKSIEILRHRQMAHYDFSDKEAISLNFNYLTTLNHLMDFAKQIINFYGSAFVGEGKKIGYNFGRRSHYLYSLERLINKANGL